MESANWKKKAILGALVGVLALLWGYNLVFKAEPDKTGKKAGKAKEEDAAVFPQAPITVDLELLDRPKEDYKAARNIFSAVYKKPELERPPAGAGPGQAGAAPPAMPPPPPPPPPKSPEQLAAEKAEADIKKLKVLGFLKRKDRMDIFFSMDSDYYVASEGGNIKEGMFLDEVGRDYIVVSDRQTNISVRLAVNFEEMEKEASSGAEAQAVEAGSRPGKSSQPPAPPARGRTAPPGLPEVPDIPEPPVGGGTGAAVQPGPGGQSPPIPEGEVPPMPGDLDGTTGTNGVVTTPNALSGNSI